MNIDNLTEEDRKIMEEIAGERGTFHKKMETFEEWLEPPVSNNIFKSWVACWKAPLEDVPLYINAWERCTRILAQFRLKTGR
jgi:hypothetical protein